MIEPLTQFVGGILHSNQTHLYGFFIFPEDFEETLH